MFASHRFPGARKYNAARALMILAAAMMLFFVAASGRARAETCDLTLGPVCNLETGVHYQTIQEGINEAQPGETIIVMGGVYPEFLTIERDIFLRGSLLSGAFAEIRPPDCSAPAITINIDDGTNADILNFTIGGVGCGTGIYGAGDHVLRVENVRITEFETGIFDASHVLAVNNSEFTNVNRGVVMSGELGENGSQGFVTRSTFYNERRNLFGSSTAIELAGLVAMTVECNKIRSFNTGLKLGNIENEFYETAVKNNSVSKAQGPNSVALSLIYSRGVEITGNLLNGHEYLMFFQSDTATVARNNALTKSRYGVYNSPEDDPEFLVDAVNNWWGARSGPSGVGSGKGVPVWLNILFDPWLRKPPVFACQS